MDTVYDVIEINNSAIRQTVRKEEMVTQNDNSARGVER